MKIVYALVMLIPLLHFLAVATTFRRMQSGHRNTQRSRLTQIARYVVLPLIWNAAIAYVLLVTLPKTFESNISTVILFQPDVGWVAAISGIFAIVWGVINTSIGISMLRHEEKEQKSHSVAI
jgi:uncharacterized protein involved in cysteine biosynthesis